MANFPQKLAFMKNAINFLTMAIFPFGNFPRDLFIMWSNFQFLHHTWSNLIFLHMPDVEKSEIYPAHMCVCLVEKSTSVICVILRTQYILCSFVATLILERETQLGFRIWVRAVTDYLRRTHSFESGII